MHHTRIARIAAIVVLMVSGSLPAPLASTAESSRGYPEYALYAAGDWETSDGEIGPFADPHSEFRPLDPETLEKLGERPVLTFEGAYPSIAASADGSTFVEIAHQGQLEDWVTVRNGAGGPVRRTIDVVEAAYSPQLSADGSRLVLSTTMMCGPSGCGEKTWFTYDPVSGELESSFSADLRGYLGTEMLTPDGARLLVPFYERPPGPTYPATPTPPGVSETGPWPLQIAAFDLISGQAIDRAQVPDVLAGSWQDLERSDEGYYGRFVDPGIALSPDGDTIAVVDAAMERLTLLDAATLEVAGIHAIHEHVGLVGRFLGWLGILPQDAAAKVSEGRGIDMFYSADGSRLYLWGEEMKVGESHADVTGRGFGLTAIDVSTGEIVATGLGEYPLLRVVVDPSGESLYVLRPETSWWEAEGQVSDHVLLRLDAETLEPLAERTFPGRVNLLLVPDQARQTRSYPDDAAAGATNWPRTGMPSGTSAPALAT